MTAQSEKQFFPAITVCTSRLEQGVTCPEMRVQDAPLNRTVESVAFKMHLGFDGLLPYSYAHYVCTIKTSSLFSVPEALITT